MTEGPLLWYLNRSSGVVLLVLLSASVVLGVLSLGGRPGGRVPRFVTQSLHRNLALLSVVALVVHVATAVLDTYVDIRWWHAFVPIGSSYEPLWVGLGALALDAIAVVVITSLARARLPQRSWRAIHVSAWAAWVLALAHGLGAGTDYEGRAVWAVAPSLACGAAVLASLGVRLFVLGRDRRPVGSHA